jgi:hypothetical protein
VTLPWIGVPEAYQVVLAERREPVGTFSLALTVTVE